MNKHRKFDKLGLFYILALSGIAVSIILSQLVVQNYIGTQQDDARTINVAGRQRMLSQKISKIALKIGRVSDTISYSQEVKELKNTVALWEKSHRGLLEGNEELGLQDKPSSDVLKMYKQIENHYTQMVFHAHKIIQLPVNDLVRSDLDTSIQAILTHEDSFLRGMNAIVFQYDKEANARVKELRKIEITLLILSLSIILIELIFVFRPIARNVRQTVDELVESEEGSIRMAGELSRLYEELVKSYQDLESTRYEPEAPLVFATIDDKGSFTSVSDKFKVLMQWEKSPESFVQLLLDNDYRKEFTGGLMKILKNHRPWSGEIKLVNEDGDFIWLELFIIPVKIRESYTYKLVARDITELKEAKIRSREINREKIEKRVKEQQYRSVLILEGQEEERWRLGREIHDGIGQMLTALKLNLEAITPSSSIHTKRRLEDTRELMKSILREIRRVSFNLTPASLSDFGITPAITKFCQEVSQLSGNKVFFTNETRFVNRLESHVENNIYRIIQEAINNAIKYAKASSIDVKLIHSPRELEITIQDDGKGFDYEKLKKTGYFESSGHGIFNMKERTAFINGTFDLNTKPEEGTMITITIPLD
ncbi:PAS domain S-box protein [Fulvivirga sp. M361]|uniref:sensor histidine kinase n=1 Tax=Fulvivirga sp. M361 TaxID=2594266 RepID=UPI00117B229F|nr:ATP-binding protein [Fulvivirga sp. M361]TRX59006.1 PAS domain S-box protein [Fulvivirga sp. M361]